MHAGMLELAKICMKRSFVKFRGKFYRQKSGTALRNPLSPLKCDLYEADLKRKISANTFRRYFGGDTFMQLSKKTK